jgi:integrase
LLDQVRDVIRVKHYSIRTEQAYLHWIRRYILFHGKRHPSELGSEHLSTFLTHLAVRGNVAASTQNQALNAILFLYREVLKQNLPWVESVQRAKRPQHLPVVLTRAEIKHLLAQLEGTVWLMAALTYGGGLRLLECLRLRVKDPRLRSGRGGNSRRQGTKGSRHDVAANAYRAAAHTSESGALAP